jgi:trimethylamine--corrinoid protein Co-methyltransferase
VALDAELVDWALNAAPSVLTMFNRHGDRAFDLGPAADGATRFGVGVTNLYYQKPDDNTVTPFSLAHVETAARLTDALPAFDLLATPGVARDLSPASADLQVTLAMAANTTKPLVLLVSEPALFGVTLDLLEELFGDRRQTPFVLPYVNPITPLVLNEDTAEKMFTAIDRGIPVIYSNMGMSGATTPITPGGTLALLNAELLAGLVFSQLVKEGTPVILGSIPAGFDMQNMMSLYTPRTMLLNLACAEMMAHYGVPHSGTSGSGPGWGADLPAAGALWLNHLTSCLGKVGLAPFVGGNLDSLVFSPAMVVYAGEVIRLARQFAGGFSLDEDAVNTADIGAVGTGGNFLTSEVTCSLFRAMMDESPLWPAMTLDQWQENNRPQAAEMLARHTAELLHKLKPPAGHGELMHRGLAFIQKSAELAESRSG